MTIQWEPCASGARVLRVWGDSPCPTLPAEVAGLPVTEIGPYCFADRPVSGGRLWGGGDDHPITGRFVEQVTLPDSVRVLHSAAFYNCRALRRLEVGPALDSLGSDLFTNCRALALFAVRTAPDAPSGLKKLVGAVSADVSAEFLGGEGARLFYPEYFEFMDENTPAHIFNHSIEGEGFRYRQCFADGAVAYAAYDASFSQAMVGEPPAKLCRLALGRLEKPFRLGEDARARYEAYLKAQQDTAFALTLRERDAGALRLLVGLGLSTVRAAADCARLGWSEGAALLVGGGRRSQKRYDFDDFT
ncbi:MAG: leucine-rich repeat protein [Gemmiger sp.]